MATDLYRVLGVERTASQDEIKRAYRRLAHQFHPDKEHGDEEKFKQVNAAYQVLGDKTKRAQYDQFGTTDNANPFGQGAAGMNYQDFDFDGFADIFSDFFSGTARGRGGRSRIRRGRDIEIDLTLDFIESANEQQREITHRLYQTCTHCRGNGAEPGTPIRDCPTCQGRGSVTTTQQTVFGAFAQQAICPTCRGEGKKAEKPCTRCHGEGREYTTRTLTVTIPAGIADGQIIRITGKGEAPQGGGQPGDLFVNIHVKTHRLLTRDHDNVRSTVTIPFADAALGAEVEVDTLTGKKALTIPAGTQPGEEIKLNGHGFPHVRKAGRGDQLVTVAVTIPKRLSRHQREALQAFRQAKTKRKGFFF
jgi:molecular chaperone DnaJ